MRSKRRRDGGTKRRYAGREEKGEVLVARREGGREGDMQGKEEEGGSET